MDAAQTTAGWLCFVVTVVGLGSIVMQAKPIQEMVDPYHASRKADHLGAWTSRQPQKSKLQFVKLPPVGPILTAKLLGGLCGMNVIGISRLPLQKPGKASWTALLAVLHEQDLLVAKKSATSSRHFDIHHDAQVKRETSPYTIEVLEAGSKVYGRTENPEWQSLPLQPLALWGSSSAISISRTTLITLLAVFNGRVMFKYSDASGHRAAYASYCGHFYVDWPIGRPAVVHFAPHDSHSISTDVYPPIFQQRVDKCVQMMAGVVVSPVPASFQCAFSGRKAPGTYILEYQRRGFPGAHGGRHLYNQMGGRVYEVDFLLARPAETITPGSLSLRIPSLEKNAHMTISIPITEQKVLEQALDNLPWSSMSWSIHRGLRDLLSAFAKPTMDKFRKDLTSRLRSAVFEHSQILEAKGWAAHFVNESMADLAANAMLAGSGNFGDLVRVVTDVVSLLCPPDSLDLDRDELLE